MVSPLLIHSVNNGYVTMRCSRAEEGQRVRMRYVRSEGAIDFSPRPGSVDHPALALSAVFKVTCRGASLTQSA
jgi:hypothetical protein